MIYTHSASKTDLCIRRQRGTPFLCPSVMFSVIGEAFLEYQLRARRCAEVSIEQRLNSLGPTI